MANALPLTELHRARGARLGPARGSIVPLDHGDPEAEHAALRRAAGLVDRSAIGKAVVTGRDRAAFLQGMLSNDVKALQPGQGCRAAFLDLHGKVLALVAVHALADRLWLGLPEGLTEKTLQTLDRYLISEKAAFEPADEAFVVLVLAGPEARAVLERASGRAPALAPGAHEEVALAGTAVRVIRRAEPETPGLECWVPAPAGEAVWDALLAAGARPAGFDAWEALRIEAGEPVYGQDVDDTVILPETRLEALVSYTKGCYIGQEVVARVKYRGHVNRGLAGLVLAGDRLPDAGAAILAGGRDVGRVTSAARSPSLGAPIALGYLRREHWTPHTPVEVAHPDGPIPARVSTLPFVNPA